MKDTTKPEELWSNFAGKTFEMLKHWGEAQQRMVKQVVDLSAVAARENARVWTEVQAGTMDTLRETQAAWLKPAGDVADLPKDPVGWYQKAVSDSTKATQTGFRLLEANLQIVTRGTERVQTAMYAASKDMQETVSTLATKMQELYATA